MKLKELNVSANIAWSPKYVQPIYLACGTSAQQYDATSNSSSVLQLYDLSPSSSSLDMKVAASRTVPERFNKILWNDLNNDNSTHPLGLIVGGCNNGSVHVYSADKLLKKIDPVVVSIEGKHSGPIYAFDYNQHQPNLLATGSSGCEILIWDIQDPTKPMTPAAKPAISANVEDIAWNKQVEHIMAATFDGRCIVYDLRKSASIIQINETVSRMKGHIVKWHPSVATQLILSSSDDATPFAQVWDLRFAGAPLRALEGHQRGIMATSWAQDDPDLFFSSGKDNKMFIWNPNRETGAEIVAEFPTYNQWTYDVSWCLKDPSLVSTSSVDNVVSVFSLLGGGVPPAQNNKFSAIADSFPGMEVPSVVPQRCQPQGIYLKEPPKWFPPRCGASFAFGGRLVSFGASDRSVTLSQVVTEPELVKKSHDLQEALSKSDYLPTSFCQAKIQAASNADEKLLWSFVSASFESSPAASYMNLLGFKPNQVASLVRPQDLAIQPEDLADKIAKLGPGSIDDNSSSLDPSEQFEMIASINSTDKTPEAEAICEVSSEVTESQQPLHLSIGEQPEGMIRHALLLADFPSAVELCLKQKNHSLALILASSAGPELFKTTQDKILKTEQFHGLSSLVRLIVQNDLPSLVSKCALVDWKEALVAVLTYSSPEMISPLAEMLGDRLASEGSSEDLLPSAVLCYVCAANLDKLVNCLSRSRPALKDVKNTSSLLELVEFIMVLERALARNGKPVELKEGSEASRYLCSYASLLACQGSLSTAASYLSSSNSAEIMELKTRLYKCLGYSTDSTRSNRIRSISTSSQRSLRKSSTPHSNQVPFSPALPSHPPNYSAPSQFYQPQPPLISQQPPLGMMQPVQPTATVHPTFGTSLQPTMGGSSVAPPIAPPTGPPTGTTGFRKANTSTRYGQDPSTMSSVPQGGAPTPFTPFQPTLSNPPTAHVSPLNPHSGFNPGLSTQQTSFPSASPSFASAVGPPNLAPPHPMAPPTFTPTESADSSHPAFTPAAYDPNVPRGWNDPPQISATKKGKMKAQIKNSNEGNTEVHPSGFMVPEQPQQPQKFAGFPSMPNSAMTQSNRFSTESGPAPPPAPKAPLPVEHQAIEAVFNHLCQKGNLSHLNPTAKQRLEDLNKKLEVLYDKIRSNQVGGTTLKGLHDICDAIKAADYYRALQIHSATINSGNFSEMSQFMPAIKMLITTCMQCQIFYH